MATEATDPMAVVQAFNDASNSGDIERVLAFFTDDSIIRTVPPPPPPDPGVYTGKQEIRAWFEPQMPNLHVEPSNFNASGDTVTWDAIVSGAPFQQMGIDSFDVTASATVQGGKVTFFTVTQTPEAVSKFQKAMAQGGSAGSGAS
jgi:ketosteroid isomerase-like protein